MSRALAEPFPCFSRMIPNIFERWRFPVQRAVHSLAVDKETHRVYTPEQEEGGKPVARMVVYEAVTSR